MWNREVYEIVRKSHVEEKWEPQAVFQSKNDTSELDYEEIDGVTE